MSTNCSFEARILHEITQQWNYWNLPIQWSTIAKLLLRGKNIAWDHIVVELLNVGKFIDRMSRNCSFDARILREITAQTNYWTWDNSLIDCRETAPSRQEYCVRSHRNGIIENWRIQWTTVRKLLHRGNHIAWYHIAMELLNFGQFSDRMSKNYSFEARILREIT